MGQRLIVGIETGYGKTNSLYDVFSLNRNQKVNNYRVAASFSFFPRSHFAAISKIVFQTKGIYTKSISFIQVPMGFEVQPGNKVRGLVGAGIFPSILINHSPNIQDTNFLKYHSDLQLCAYIDLGIIVRVTQLLQIFATYHLEGDLTSLDSYPVTYYFPETNKYHTEQVRNKTYGYTVNIGLYYTLFKKK
jgi:hypothetical protein